MVKFFFAPNPIRELQTSATIACWRARRDGDSTNALGPVCGRGANLEREYEESA